MENQATNSQKLLQRIKALRFFKPGAFIVLFAIIGVSILYLVHASNFQEFKLYDPQATGSFTHLGTNKVLAKGNVTGYLYIANVHDVKAYFHDNTTGQSTNVLLGQGGNAAASAGNPRDYVWTTNNTLITISQDENTNGKITLRRYQLSGSPLPTTATLIGSYGFGNSSSRADNIIQLASGAIVANWHEQNSDPVPQNATIAYWPVGGSSWQIQNVLMRATRSSKGVVIQHPADKSVWLIINADGEARVQAAHLTEINASLRLDWTNYDFIAGDQDVFLNGPDPENPDLAVAVDSSTGEIVLAYESNDRQPFTINGKYYIGSHPVVARIKADSTITYSPRLPIYVERVSQISLVVKPGEVWLAYYPLDLTSGKFNQLYASQYVNGQWQQQTFLGESGTTSGGILQGSSRAEFVTTLYDVNLVSRVSTFTFETNAIGPSPPSDTVPPTANITAPSNGNTVSGTINVTATASDNGTLADVKLYLDGSIFLGSMYNSTNKTFNSVLWDTTKIGNGNHTLVAKAFDAAGNEGDSATITIAIQNIVPPPPDSSAPTVQITSPTDGTRLKGSSINIMSTAHDDVAVTKSELYIDNQLVSSISGSDLSYVWNTQKISRGTHIILVKAYDGANNIGSAQVSVTK